MAKGFFDKLNTLVQAHINDIVSPMDDDDTGRARKKALSRQEIRGGLQKDVGELRKRVNDALDYQDELQAKADKLYQEIADWDAKADKAVEEGREDDARFAIRRMQQTQRELDLTEASLREHRTLTQDLISQVNTLEGVVAQSENRTDDDTAPPDVDNSRVDDIGRNLSAKLDKTREKLNELVSSYRGPGHEYIGSDDTDIDRDTGNRPQPRMYSRDEVVDEVPQPDPPRRNHPISDDKVDDDYASRLSRLSKPEDDD
jgi:septal ring factor EnvC (AmiA/AmiB activator)